MIEKEVWVVTYKLGNDIWWDKEAVWGVGMVDNEIQLVHFNRNNVNKKTHKETLKIPDEIYAKYCLWRLEQ